MRCRQVRRAAQAENKATSRAGGRQQGVRVRTKSASTTTVLLLLSLPPDVPDFPGSLGATANIITTIASRMPPTKYILHRNDRPTGVRLTAAANEAHQALPTILFVSACPRCTSKSIVPQTKRW